jgi:Ca-activated chloride channel family protein
MSHTLPLLTDQEMTRSPLQAEAGFGTLRSERGPFPLQALSVQARIDGLLAEVEVCQTFVNVLQEPLEATYIFPLPDRAAVSSFFMEVAGRRIEGILKERGQAREEYQQAIQAGHRAAISEEERPNVFSLRVGNLLAGEKATVRFRMVQPLLFSEGEATFRFPLVVAPRYIPGTPLAGPTVGKGTQADTDAVPDASRITPPVLLPGFPNPVHLELKATINPGGLLLSDLKSSLHAVCVCPQEGSYEVEIQPGERLNRDFVLRFRLGDKAVETGLLLHPDKASSKEGTFTLTIVPPQESLQQQRPRDLVFLLDRSGSMSGWKMVAARRALIRMIETLTEADRFTVLAFDNEVSLPPGFSEKELLPASSSHRFRCVEWLHNVGARGGTELHQPLNTAVTLLSARPAERERGLVLLTDGQVGNEDDILRMLGQRLAGLRIFTLGIDQAVNEGFLKRLALLGGGAAEIVESEQRLDEVMGKIHRRLGTPVLTGLQIKGEGLQLDMESLTPQRLPDLFAGAPLVVSGRYRGEAEGEIALQAKDAVGRPWHAAAKGRPTEHATLTKLWARHRLRDLEDQYAAGSEDQNALERQIVATSLQHGVLCRFTAFVAVDRSAPTNPDGSPRQIVQPVEYPEGWDDPEAGPTRVGRVAMSYGRAAPMMAQARYRMAPAPAPAAKAKSAGALFGLFPQAQSAPVPTPTAAASAPVADLTAYRQRASSLIGILRQEASRSVAVRAATLGIVVMRLRELLEDLRSVGAEAKELEPLEQLVQSLTPVVAATDPQEPELQAGWTRAEQVLQAFVAGPQKPAERKGFWK